MTESAQSLNRKIERMVRRGFRGFPVATVAYYGPDNRFASKVVAAVFSSEERPAEPMAKWVSADLDARHNAAVLAQVLQFLESNNVRSVVVTPGIYGCPHEEGLDYPEGQPCHLCPFWASHDREQIFRDRPRPSRS